MPDETGDPSSEPNASGRKREEPEQAEGTSGLSSQPNTPGQTDQESQTAHQQPGWATRFWKHLTADYGRIPRWLVAIVVLGGYSYGLLHHDFHVCNEETLNKGADKSVTQTCNEPAVSDAGVVAIALMIVLLFTPDMNEIGVFGVSLKRRLKEAEEKAGESAAKADRLEDRILMQSSRIENLSQNLSSANAQATSNFYLVTGEELKQRDEGLSDKAKLWRSGQEEVEPDVYGEDYVSTPANAELSLRLVRNSEILAASLDIPPYRRGQRTDIPRVKLPAADADRFANLFSEELKLVRAARNNVAHARPITNEDLQAAVDMSDRLLDILQTPPEHL